MIFDIGRCSPSSWDLERFGIRRKTSAIAATTAVPVRNMKVPPNCRTSPEYQLSGTMFSPQIASPAPANPENTPPAKTREIATLRFETAELADVVDHHDQPGMPGMHAAAGPPASLTRHEKPTLARKRSLPPQPRLLLVPTGQRASPGTLDRAQDTVARPRSLL